MRAVRQRRQCIKQFLTVLGIGLYASAGIPMMARPLLYASKPIVAQEKQESGKILSGNEIRSLREEAMRLQSQEKYSAAVKIYERLRVLAEAELEPPLPFLGFLYRQLGFIYYRTKDYGKAEPLLLKSVDIASRGGEDDGREIADSLWPLGNIYWDQGNFSKAESALQRSLYIYSKDSKTNAYEMLSIGGLLAVFYKGRGDYSKAEQLLVKSASAAKKLLGENHETTLILVGNLGALYTRMGDAKKAELLLQKVIDARAKIPGRNQTDSAADIDSLADLYRLQKNYAKAEKLLLGIIKILESAKSSTNALVQRDLAIALNTLAHVYENQGRYLKAEPLLIRSLEIKRRSGRQADEMARSMYNLAYLYAELGNYAKAEFFYKQSVSMLEGYLGRDHMDVYKFYDGLAEFYLHEARCGLGISALKRSLAGELKWLKEQLPFFPAGRRAMQLATFGNSDDMPATWLQVCGLEAASLVIENRLNRKGILQEIEKSQVILGQGDEASAQLVKQIKDLTLQLSGIEVARAARSSLLEKRDELERQLYRQLPGLEISPVSIADVVQAIPENGILVDFQKYSPYDVKRVQGKRWGKPLYLALILAPNGAISTFLLGPAKPIDDAIHKALKATTANTSDASQLWESVSRLVLSPLKAQLMGKRQWFISPDGELNRVPFAALPYPLEPSETVGSAVQLRLLTTGRDLVRLEKAPAKGQVPLVLANPNYDRAELVASRSIPSAEIQVQQRSSTVESGRWSPLPATKREGELVAALIGSTSITGDQATTTRLQQSKGPRVLHVATHGFFAPDQESKSNDALRSLQDTGRQLQGVKGENPMLRSGLVLAGANQPNADPSDDGYLTAAEAAKLQLEGTELVTLSACSTGQGDIRSGEGVYGLQRALTVAGARSTLLSLWKVDDKATAEFMVRLYKRLKAGEPRSDALAATQKEFRDGKTGIPGWSDPFYWAAWQLVGDWRPIKGL